MNTHFKLSYLFIILLLSGLTVCDAVEPMTIVPLKYAPVKVIRGSVSNPTVAQNPKGSNDWQQISLIGCWEHRPDKPEARIIRREFSYFALSTYNHRQAEALPDQPFEQTESGTVSFFPNQRQLQFNVSYPPRREGIEIPDTENLNTLIMDGLTYTRQEGTCW